MTDITPFSSKNGPILFISFGDPILLCAVNQFRGNVKHNLMMTENWDRKI